MMMKVTIMPLVMSAVVIGEGSNFSPSRPKPTKHQVCRHPDFGGCRVLPDPRVTPGMHGSNVCFPIRDMHQRHALTVSPCALF